MNALPLFDRLLTVITRHKLDVVLIGNAAAAIHGAPVTTVDFDFMFHDTPANMRKLKAVASTLEAVIVRPYYPVSKLYRMVDDARGLQADFMPVIHGVRSFDGLRARATGSRRRCGGERAADGGTDPSPARPAGRKADELPAAAASRRR